MEVDHEEKSVSLQEIGTNGEVSVGSDMTLSFKDVVLDIDLEVDDIVNVKGQQSRNDAADFEAKSIKHEIVNLSREEIIQVTTEDEDVNTRHGPKLAIAFVGLDDEMDDDEAEKPKSFYLLNRNAESSNFKVGDRFTVKKVRIHQHQVDELQREFHFRIIAITSQKVEDIEKGISVSFERKKYFRSSFREGQLRVTVNNDSDEKVKLFNCEIEEANHEELENVLKIPQNVLKAWIKKKSPHWFNLKVFPHTAHGFGAKLKFTFKTCLDEEFHKTLLVDFNVRDGLDKIHAPRIPAPRFIDSRIPTREKIPDTIRALYSKKVADALEEMKIQLNFTYGVLTKDNYKTVLAGEEYLEELEREKRFEELVDKFSKKGHRIMFVPDGNGRFKFAIDEIGEMTPAIAIGDRISVMNPAPGSEDYFDGRVVKVFKDDHYLLLEFDARFDPNGEYDVKIEFNKSLVNLFHHGINIIGGKFGVENLFPEYEKRVIEPQKKAIIDTIRKFYNEDLDEYQRDAVKKAVRGEMRPLPFIIHGPPG